MSRSFDTPCTVEVEHGFNHLHAHVELDGDVEIYPGDKVRVHGTSIRLPYGERIVEHEIMDHELFVNRLVNTILVRENHGRVRIPQPPLPQCAA